MLEAAGAQVYLPNQDESAAIVTGLRMLLRRKLVAKNDNGYRIRPGELPLVQYYADSIAHLIEEKQPTPSGKDQ